VINGYKLPPSAISGDAKATDIKFIPSVVQFGSGIYTSSVVVPIRVKYWIPGSSSVDDFNLTIKPTSAIYEDCNAFVSTMITVTTPQPDVSYTVGTSAITISPGFTLNTAACTLSGVTNIPTLEMDVSLQYQSGTDWLNFP